MKERQLTAAQITELQPYERHFKQATEAAWCSYPGQAAIDKMRDIWLDLTGTKYPYQPGCSNCLLNLVRDLGHIYFAQKEAAEKAQTPTAATCTPEYAAEHSNLVGVLPETKDKVKKTQKGTKKAK